MLRVSYVNPMGYVTKKGHREKIWLCYANCGLWAEIQTYKGEDGKYNRQLGSFIDGNEHLKRCIMAKDYPMKLNNYTYHFNTAQKNKVDKTTIWLLTYAGAKVEFYYKPYKKRTII